MDNLESDYDFEEPEIIYSEDIIENVRIIPRLANLIPALSDIDEAAFTPKDLRGGPNSDDIIK